MAEKQTGKRLALVVASYEFQDDTLQQLVAPAQDAEALARVLDDAAIGGFDQVKVLTNRPSHQVRLEIASFFADRKRDDLLLLYFSGHGVKDDDGRLYLATTDTRRKLLRATAVPATFVNETMTASRSRRQVLILDCCHSGAFARGMVAKGGESVGVPDRFEGRGRVVLTASNSTQYAFQGDEIIGESSRSVFTHHLVQGLETGQADLDDDGWVSLDELYDYVYGRVTDRMHQQTPGKWTFDLQGDILIARNPRWTVKPVELPSELLQAIESPFTGVREGAVGELDRLLQGSHPGLALAARAALDRLADDDSRRVSTAATESLETYARVEREAQAAEEREREERERSAREQADAERLAAQKAEAERAAQEKAEQERLAREKGERERLAQLYEQAGTALRRKRWQEARQRCADIEALEPGYRDVSALLQQAEAGLRLEQEAQLAQARKPATHPQRRQVPVWAWIAGGVALLALLLCIGVTLGPKLWEAAFAPATPTPLSVPASGSLGDTWTRPTDEMMMVYVPGGAFQMGSSDAEIDAAFAQCEQVRGSGNCERSRYDNESPSHAVILDGYWIDRAEVTNAQYALCVADGECNASAYADNTSYNGANYPVVGVSWSDAVAYCEWAGARLPTEAEWEYAARGPNGYIYPWGDTFDGTRLNFCDANCTLNHNDTDYDDGYEKTAPVGSYQDGASWCGAWDMAGNVWEWVADFYGDYPSEAQANPTGPATGSGRVVRGGLWTLDASQARSAYRIAYVPSSRGSGNGFRCVAASVEQPGSGPIETPTERPTETPTELPTVRPTIPTSTPRPTDTPSPTPEPPAGTTQIRFTDGMTMAYVPGGTFQMGSTDDEIDAAFAQCEQDYGNCVRSWFERESPSHAVILDGYWIDQTEVTNAQYALCVADGECNVSAYADDIGFNGDYYPVVGVSWSDAVAYCEWAGARLPTEAEWEYAARGGQKSQGYLYAGSGSSDDVAWYGDNSGGRTRPVAQKAPNELGLYDMSGNVWEWVADWYRPYVYWEQVNPDGPSSGDDRVVRGGSWGVGRDRVRCAVRGRSLPDDSDSSYGFRCVSPVGSDF